MHSAGAKIPKGQWILIGIFAMHRKAKLWKDPDSFVPERWIEGSPENKDLPLHAYIPFGDGPRACVGGKFALQEAKHTLLLMFQQVYLELAPFQSKVKHCKFSSPFDSMPRITNWQAGVEHSHSRHHACTLV